ncbi:FAD-dependent monooxygenase [Algoriphagus sp. A40]|uniref:FAD-dependent monooxygenase n=1 Tax=Algoriphagus sp. A40 TaxID=1945863 RepID=UPI0009870C23|nr:FAD-dependent monooxygenase [Algoriphagus sp. A40]OOG77156.1 monooxygenase [Algoriphagus sp. A40]
MKSHPYVILGGGIAGLTTAIALKQIGIEAVVIEAAAEIKPVGAGLALAANAMMALLQIGIADQVIPEGRELKAFSIYDQKGQIITRTDTDPAHSRFGISNFTIHRADLHRVLLAQLEPKNVITGMRSVDFSEDSEGYLVRIENGEQIRAKYLIVAEGIHSSIGKQLLPDAKIRFSGYTCWRGVMDNSGLNIAETSETWGKNGRFGVTPLSKKQVYWYACINAPTPNSSLKSYTKADLEANFKDFHFPIPEVLAGTKPDQIIWNDILDLEPLSQFAFGNAVLIGDAAHATTPNMGQGACMAIEDAAVLACCLKRNSDPALAFLEFEKRRLPRTQKIVKDSWRLGKIAQLENPLLMGLRNSFFRMIPKKVTEKQLEALYQVDLS